MNAVEYEGAKAGRTVVYCIGETAARVMDRAASKLDDLPGNAEWFCIRGGPFGMGSLEMIRRDLKDKEYLLLLFDLRDGYDDMFTNMCSGAGGRRNGADDQCFYFAVEIVDHIAKIAREQGLKVFSAVAEDGILGDVFTRKYLYKGLWSIGDNSDCILTLPYTEEQPPEKLLWQASQLLLSMTMPQYISLELADVRELFPNGGRAYLGAGHADAAQPARAASELLSSREFTEHLKQAGGLLIHLSCPEAGADPQSIEQAARSLQNTAPPDADIIWSIRLEEAPQTGTHIIVLAADPWNKIFKQRQAEAPKREKIENRRPGHLYPDRMPRKKVIKQLWQAIENALHARYGTRPDAAIARRVREEWAAMTRCKDIENVAALYEFTQWLKSEQAPYWMAGTAGSSLILYLLDVTAANPLPPHYMYPCDKHILWHPAAADGFDLPAAIREAADGFGLPAAFRVKADHLLHRNGHNIPWQIHWGPEGWDGEPHYCLHLPKPLKEQVQAFWADHWLGRLQPASVSMRQDERGGYSMHFSRFCFVFDLDPNELGAGLCSAAPGQTVHRKAVPFSERLTQFGMQPFAEAPCEPEPEKAGEPNRFVFRDDVFLYLQDQGFSEKDAWRGMRAVMMGEELPSDIAETAPSLDRQTLAQMKKARYLFPKAHAVEYLLFCRREVYRNRIIQSSIENLPKTICSKAGIRDTIIATKN